MAVGRSFSRSVHRDEAAAVRAPKAPGPELLRSQNPGPELPSSRRRDPRWRRPLRRRPRRVHFCQSRLIACHRGAVCLAAQRSAVRNHRNLLPCKPCGLVEQMYDGDNLFYF